MQWAEAGLGWGEMTVLVPGESSLELQPLSCHGEASALQLSCSILLTLPCTSLSPKPTAFLQTALFQNCS